MRQGPEPGQASAGRVLPALSGPACFQQVLAVRPCARTEHFLLHHLAEVPPMPPETKLSTGTDPGLPGTVDDTPAVAASVVCSGLDACRLGLVVPKRHARRAVTRNLIKRQARVLLAQAGLAPGDWVLRLRAPFDPRRYPSAASDALRRAVRGELQQLGQQLSAPRRPRKSA